MTHLLYGLEHLTVKLQGRKIYSRIFKGMAGFPMKFSKRSAPIERPHWTGRFSATTRDETNHRSWATSWR